MDEKVNSETIYTCKICNHNKKFHNTNSKTMINVSNNNIDKSKHDEIINTCKCCNKKFSCKQSRWRHEKTCKLIDNNKIEDLKKQLSKYDEKNKELENTINEMKKQVAQIVKEKGKIHHKTLQKINNNISNSNINNGNITNINNTFVKFGNIEYKNIFTPKQERQVLNKKYLCIEESILKFHFNEDFPEYGNIFITNMKDDLAYIFNGSKFIMVKKNEVLNELIDIHKNEINLSLERNINKLNESYVTKIEDFLNRINQENVKFTDENNNRTYPSYKAYKMDAIKLLIYNNSDKKKLEMLNKIELHEKVLDLESDTETDSLVV